MTGKGESQSGSCAGIEIIPMGSVYVPQVESVAHALRLCLGCTVSIVHPIGLPEGAYRANRGQYDASMILDAARPSVGKRGWKRLVISNRDLFAAGLNFVFGQADLSGAVAVISLVRLANTFYGLPQDDNLFIERGVKEAVHEIGHTLGLVHCKVPCVMYFSNSLTDTDRKSAAFCADCRARLAAKEKK